MKLGKRIGLLAGRGALLTLMAVLRNTPYGASLAFGRSLGRLMRRTSKKRYNVALKNLRIAYGDALTPDERETIARTCFEHFGMFAVESIKFGYLSQAEAERRVHVPAEAAAMVDEALGAGKGCLLITGHLGNFEVAARWLVGRGHRLLALARETRDRGVTGLMLEARERCGIEVINLGHSLKPVFLGLRKGACVAIISDQNAADVFVPFFGHPTGTVDGPARISLKTGAPMVFFSCLRDGNGGYVARPYGVVWPEPTDDTQADVIRLATEMNARIERMIRDCPEQWLWFHDRWRASPEVKDPDAAPTA